MHAQKNHDDIIDGIRKGRVFVTLGDLITELYVRVEGGHHTADIGGTIQLPKGENVRVTIRFKDPDTLNSWNQNPKVTRVDLIMGAIKGPVADRDTDNNPTTAVMARFTEADWTVNGGFREITYTISKLRKDSYIRIRGTNSIELEPQEDEKGESPWDELWFYSNPIFIDVE